MGESVRAAPSPTREPLPLISSPVWRGEKSGALWSIPLGAAVLVAAAAGLLLEFAFEPVGWWPLGFVSVTAALLTLIGRSLGGALLVGLVYGAVFYVTRLVWVGEFLGPVPWLALSGLEAVLFGLGAIPLALAYRWTSHGDAGGSRQLIGVPLLISAVWTAREVAMGVWPYSGFPWSRIGMTQINGPLVDVVSWTGVTGLTFLIVLICAGLVQALRATKVPFARRTVPTASLLIVLLITPQFPTTPSGNFNVGWVQGNGPAGYFDDKEPGDVLASQISATTPLYGQPMDLLAWPEGGVDADPLNSPSVAAALDQVVQAAQAPLLMNAATVRGDDVYNTSILWTTDSADRQLHDKINPVPFGEYVPDRWFYEMIAPDLVGLIQREYTPGANSPFVQAGDVGIGLAICFDVIYDAVIWDGARQGAQLYVFQTNNADFRGTNENLQQLTFARIRAIETGRAVVNVSTVGTSQVIAPDGTVLDSIDVDEAGSSITSVPLRTGLTPAAVIGPWLTPVIVLAAGSFLGMAGFFSLARSSGHRDLTNATGAARQDARRRPFR